MTIDLLPAIEAYVTARISDLAKFHVEPQAAIRELEGVRALVRGLVKQNELLERTFNHPCNKP